MVCQLFFNQLGLAYKDNRDLPLPGSHNGSSNFLSGGKIPSHDINGNYGTFTQKKRPYSLVPRTSLPL
jgi:hypothetical protein